MIYAKLKPAAERFKTNTSVAFELPAKIEVKQQGRICGIVPSHVWRTRSFKWHPLTFILESEALQNKFIEASVQNNSLRTFMENPQEAMTYGISGNPDDTKAKYLAAFLVSCHLKANSKANPKWVPIYGGFDALVLDSKPTMLIITGLTPLSTASKLEKARDLLEKYPDIPRIVVIAGQDPISFFATKLHMPINGLAYLAESLVKQHVATI